MAKLPQVLNFAPPRQAAAPKLPLAELLDRLRQFRPPIKGEALLAAEAERSRASDEAEAIRTLLQSRYAILIAHGQGDHRKPPPTDVRELEAKLKAAEAAKAAARERVEVEIQPWRRSYLKTLAAEVTPVRQALHELIAELDAGLSILHEAGWQASNQGVGSAWICRTADDILRPLRFVREHLALDARILAAE